MAESAAGALAPSASPAQNPSDSSATPPPADDQPWRKQKHKVKVNGQEAEVPYDELITGYQLRQASDAKLRAAADQQRQLQELWTKADPDSFFKNRKIDPHDWAEKLLIQKIRREKMTPEERAVEEERAREQGERDAFKSEKEAFEAQQKEQITRQAVQSLDSDISAAFKATGMAPDPALVDLVARRMEADLDQDQAPDAKKALDWALNYLDGKVQKKLESLSADDLRKMLPKKLLDDLRRQDVELVRSQSPVRGQGNGTSAPPSQAKKAAKMSTEGWFKNMEAKLTS